MDTVTEGDERTGTGREAWLSLVLVDGLGPATLRRLLQRFGLPEHILAADRTSLAEIAGEAVADRIRHGIDRAQLRPALDWLARPGNQLITLDQPDYPPTLLEFPDPPPLLFVAGNPEVLCRPSIAIVGSRNATAQGLANARAFAQALSEAGLSIVSGLAVGIDGAAHRGGLEGGSGSVAVLGTGIDRVYPAQHLDLARAIAADGALISEFPLGTGARASNFPRRNRIISGLARGCLVVEAALGSGSLITAGFALEQGREVFAIPGSIHSPLAKGCHRLIKQGAKLVECVDDILGELRLPARSDTGSRNARSKAAPTLRWPTEEPVEVHDLARENGLTPEQVSAILLKLQIDGDVASLPGGRYQRIHHNL